jgi:amino acid adenylation domain-containing protein
MTENEKERRLIEDAYPLTQVQAAMVFHNLLDARAGIYHDVMSIHIRERFDEACMHRSLQQMCDRHPVLRTYFDLTRFSRSLQVVCATSTMSLTVIENPDPGSDHAFPSLDWYRVEAAHPFAPDSAPLMRAFVHAPIDGGFLLSLSFHHAILDGWSLSILRQEIVAAYRQECGAASMLSAPPPALFREMVALEQRALADVALRDFWKGYLSGVRSSMLPRSSEQALGDHDSVSHVETLSRSSSDAVWEVSRDWRVPPKAVFLAALLTLLAELCATDEVCAGVVLNCRPEVEGGDRALGMFLNTVPMRMHLDHGGWRELVQDVFTQEQRIFACRRLPLAEIVRLSGQPTPFDVVFDYRHFHDEDSRTSKTADHFRSAHFLERTNFAVTFAVSRSADGQLAVLKAQGGPGFPKQDLRDLLSRYQVVLERMLGGTQGPRRRARGPSANDEALLAGWNATERAYPLEKTLDELIQEAIERHPEAPALRDGDRAFSYADMGAAASRLAHFLRRSGAGPGVHVGVCQSRSAEMVISLVAILKAGASYVPLDPDYPQARLAFMIADAGLSIVLTDEASIGRLPEMGFSPIVLERLHDTLQNFPSTPPARQHCASDPAYVIYTSGSTGRPKGVLNAHSGVVNRLLWMCDEFSFGPADVFMQKTPVSFDVSVWELFCPLLVGASLVVPAPKVHRDPDLLGRLVEREAVTIIHFVPSMLQAFLVAGDPDRCQSLRAVVCSGEALTRQLQAAYFASFAAPLHNLYGPTEAAVDVSHWRCREEPSTHSVPIGRPIANVGLHIVDRLGRHVPVGTVGELVISGVQVAQGYLRRPALTAERFVPDYGSPQGGRIYRTGDAGRWREDGNVEYLGRRDRMVKFHGHRLQLEEIEHCLLSHRGVREALARVVHDADQQPVLVAFVVWKNSASADTEELRRILAAELPAAVIPNRIIHVQDGFPLTPNGKLDEQALHELVKSLRPETGPDAPGSPSERLVASIWQTILGIGRLGLHDNYFALGGDSIRSIRVVAELKASGVQVSVADLFAHQTVADLAAFLDGRARGSAAAPVSQPFEILSEQDRHALLALHSPASPDSE